MYGPTVRATCQTPHRKTPINLQYMFAPPSEGSRGHSSCSEDAYESRLSFFDRLYPLLNARSIRITVTDKAGRTNSAAINANWDRTKPPTPSLSSHTGFPYSEEPFLPRWDWTCNAADLVKYQYSWNASIWADIITSLTTYSYTPDSRPFGPSTLYVRAVDDDTNVSSYGYLTLYYSPTDIRPFWGETGVILTPTVAWLKYSEPYYYELYAYRYKIDPEPEKPIVSGLKETSYKVPEKMLQSKTQYAWWYVVYHMVGTKRYNDFNSKDYFKSPFWFTTR